MTDVQGMRSGPQFTYPLAGALIGAGAPVGAFLLRFLAFRTVREHPLGELRANAFFYLYELLGTSLVFATLGLAAGRKADRLRRGEAFYHELAEHDSLTGLHNERAFLDPRTIAAYLFLMVYAFAVILITVCYVMLSMKRLRDRALPTGLAGALPLAALLDGALRWVQPQVPDVPFWLVVVCDLVLVAVVAWTVFELGLRESRRG